MALSAAIGFVGAGNMAEAIARGILRSGQHAAGEMIAADPNPERRRVFAEMGIAVTEASAEAMGAGVVLLAVKPQMMGEALGQVKGAMGGASGPLVVSIAAGITTGFIERELGEGVRVVRVMPNTPMLVGAGMSALCGGRHATTEDLAVAERIFQTGGKTIRVEERLMDAVTAVSGSGPAYVFYLCEAMAGAGEKLGLSKADAALLARQTVVGAARLLAESTDTAAELRRKVTSPGGTTQAAITTLEERGLMGVLAEAIAAAERRGKELSK